MKRLIPFMLIVSFLFGAKLTENNLCYKTRTIMHNKNLVFKALKQVLMNSHLNIETVTNQDGVLLAKGMINNEDEDTITNVTVTISFEELDSEKTKVSVIASYSTKEFVSDSTNISAAGIKFPIPIKMGGEYKETGSGNINDPLWYQAFYSSLDKSIFEIVMVDGDKDKKIAIKEETTEN